MVSRYTFHAKLRFPVSERVVEYVGMDFEVTVANSEFRFAIQGVVLKDGYPFRIAQTPLMPCILATSNHQLARYVAVPKLACGGQGRSLCRCP